MNPLSWLAALTLILWWYQSLPNLAHGKNTGLTALDKKKFLRRCHASDNRHWTGCWPWRPELDPKDIQLRIGASPPPSADRWVVCFHQSLFLKHAVRWEKKTARCMSRENKRLGWPGEDQVFPNFGTCDFQLVTGTDVSGINQLLLPLYVTQHVTKFHALGGALTWSTWCDGWKSHDQTRSATYWLQKPTHVKNTLSKRKRLNYYVH